MLRITIEGLEETGKTRLATAIAELLGTKNFGNLTVEVDDEGTRSKLKGSGDGLAKIDVSRPRESTHTPTFSGPRTQVPPKKKPNKAPKK